MKSLYCKVYVVVRNWVPVELHSGNLTTGSTLPPEFDFQTSSMTLQDWLDIPNPSIQEAKEVAPVLAIASAILVVATLFTYSKPLARLTREN